MNREELFIARVDELRQRLDSQKEYDIISASDLVYKLILDRKKELAFIVNINEIPIEYRIALSPAYENMVERGDMPNTYYTLDGIHPPSALTRHKVKIVTLDEFLSTFVVAHKGTEYTIHQVLETATKVLGGRHAGKPFKDHEAVLASETAKIGGTNITTRQVLGIGNVVYDALFPLYEDVKVRLSQ